MGGCATTSRITEPTSADSTLLVGRIKATCKDFEPKWKMNGEHTNGIVIDLRNISTNEVISVRSRGADGLFYLVDPKEGLHVIERFSLTTGSTKYTFNLWHMLSDNVTFTIDQNAVHNLGDIEWQSICITKESKEYSKTGSYTKYDVQTSHYYLHNYAELKTWFETTYPDSSWTKMNWINVP
jgi:hypothetical protein